MKRLTKWQRDVYDDSVAWASFTEPGNRLSIVSRLLLQHYDDQPLNFLVADFAVFYPFHYEVAERVDLGPYLLPVFAADQPLLGAWLPHFWQPGQVMQTYVLLDKAIAGNLAYEQREQPGVQTPATTLQKNRAAPAGIPRHYSSKPAAAWDWRRVLSAATCARPRSRQGKFSALG